jgi:hypothetical protein
MRIFIENSHENKAVIILLEAVIIDQQPTGDRVLQSSPLLQSSSKRSQKRERSRGNVEAFPLAPRSAPRSFGSAFLWLQRWAFLWLRVPPPLDPSFGSLPLRLDCSAPLRSVGCSIGSLRWMLHWIALFRSIVPHLCSVPYCHGQDQDHPKAVR